MSDFDLSFEWLWFLLMFYGTNIVIFFFRKKTDKEKSYVAIVFLY